MAEGMVLLQSRTKRGKQLIKDHGVYWDVLWHNPDSMAFGGGPAYWIQSRVEPSQTRWIKENGEPHFRCTYSRGTGKDQLDSGHDQEQPNAV